MRLFIEKATTALKYIRWKQEFRVGQSEPAVTVVVPRRDAW